MTYKNLSARGLLLGIFAASGLTVNPDGIRSLTERDGQSILALMSGDIPIDASIDWFNEPAFALVFKRGFKQVCLRLDKRCQEKE
ncbi:MAG: hypothetical protein KDD35_07395 [Bdellovibrionales bacterium]|nr:hypothetical protein [Bdellovibrionales bacterium]